MENEDEAPDWAKNEIKEAIRILKEDGLHIHRTYNAFMASKTETKDDSKDSTDADTSKDSTNDSEGNPPPNGAKNTPPRRKSVWWGDRLES